ncbi:phosphohydrolase [Flagellimonas yonaguniensis]|jgi:(p)ppGpp synthase/HD superfamily hydrolase|uniref:Phosphohydrolase n=1 Tax=Flagellimonas yonaguniensis TaxID=3031325 RepID=A0ABT5XUQ7_9FLAO|nr:MULTISPECIES: phosphohydrolase [Allomuricauda]MDF0714919.1 phosphohydrolase [[Muricauda] yonaguniensis]
MDILERTKDYAIRKHKSVNQKYGEHDYDFHLNMVFETALKFIHLIEFDERENVLAACWVHDIIEDARETYNDVKRETNETIAELAYALTNEKGRTRQERANDKYYKGIRETKNASFIKFCDRIANVTHSKNNGSRMFEKYKVDNEAFITKIFVPECEEVSEYLKKILEE